MTILFLVLVFAEPFVIPSASATPCKSVFDRVNPLDYFIDILEEIVKPDLIAEVNYKELSKRWVLHNGYHVPPDLLGSTGLAWLSIDEYLAH